MLNRHLLADIVLQGGHKAAPQQGIGENMMLREILTILLGSLPDRVAKALMQKSRAGRGAIWVGASASIDGWASRRRL